MLALKVVAVTNDKWSFTRGSKCSDMFGFLVNWSLMRVGHLREVLATGGLTVVTKQLLLLKNIPISRSE